jgi:predicted permease
MNDRVHTVVGVLPPLPTYPGNNDIWVPAGACPFRSAPATMASRNARLPTIIARVRQGVGYDAAMRELGLISNRLHAQFPAAYPQAAALHWDAKTVRDEMTYDSKKLLLILFATAFFLMIVAAANFAGLTVARQLRRTREIAVREALGAGRLTIFRQLAAESLLLSLTGGVLGSLLAMSTMGILRSFATRLTPRAGEIGIDGVVLVFAVLTCVVVGLAAAAAPLIRLRGFTPLADRLRQGAGAMGGRAEARLRRAFVLVQVAIAFVLLVGAGLVGRSLRHLQQVDAGFDGHDVMTARVTLNFSKYNSTSSVQAFDEELLRRLANTPATAVSAISTNLPLSNSVSRSQAFIIDGIDAKSHDGTPPRADFTSVSAKYFDVINVPIRRGRAFTDADRDTIAPPVIVSQRLVANNWAGRDPIGTRISTDSGRTWNSVVGVAGDVRQLGLDQDVTDQIYFPAGGAPPGDVQIMVRFKGNESAIPGVLRNIVHGIDPQQAIASIQTMDQIRGTRLSEPMLTTALLSIFGAVALLLAALGLAGVIGYSVTQRIPEIAHRMALGADPGRVMRLVGFDGLSIVAVGLAAGAVAALALSRFIASLLFSTPPHDPLTYVGVTAILFGTSVIACMGPIRRAIAADPARALRGG